MLESVGSVSKTPSYTPLQSGGKDYRIKLGDTLGDIAQRNGVSVDVLAKANGITNPNKIFAGQTITIPTGGKTQTVERGDTLTKIAAENNTTVDALMKANPEIRNANQIYPGQVVRIAGAEARPAPKAAPRVQNPQAPVAKAPAASKEAVGPTGSATTGIIEPGKASIKAADLAERRAMPKSKGECYAWVKRALQDSGAVSRYLVGVPAKGAGPELVKEGYTNVLGKPGYNIKSPYDAPKGAVLVYGAAPGVTDKNAKYGHIEIRTDNGFASDYKSAKARTGAASNGLVGTGDKARVLIGVYIKPDAGAKPVQVPVAASSSNSSGNAKQAPVDQPFSGSGKAPIVTEVKGKRVYTNPNVDYSNINSTLGTKINFNKINKSEGGVYLDSYVPWSSKSKSTNNSGVTIVGGLDLGGKDRSYFKGLPESIIDKLAPSFGKHKAEALQWNKGHPIRLTTDEANILQTFMTKQFAKEARNYFDNNKASGVPQFSKLSSAQQTVFYDRYFNAGTKGIGKAFYSHALKGDWSSAAQSLRATAAAHPTWKERLIENANMLVDRI
jgi:LysM repeat protein